MQTKTSYGAVKWLFLAGLACSMAACVVSSGDGDDDNDDPFDGGDGGTNSTAGKTSTTGGGGSSSTAGSKADGGMPTMTDGGMPTMTDGGMPGATFVPGECEGDAPLVPADQPLSLCDAAAGDNACIACLKENACEQILPCFGSNPTTACSTGMTEGADGQFECIRKCFTAGAAEATDAMELLYECGVECDECGTGGPNGETLDLVAAANDPAKCQTECFPFE